MRKTLSVAFSIFLCFFAQQEAQAASQVSKQNYALKSNETFELTSLYWVVNCRSQLTGTPEVTILDGPPSITAVVTEANVVPRVQNCARPVKGAKLMLKADKIEEQSEADMTLRIRYPTKDGDRSGSMAFTLSLFP